jgi:hypothetical protein
MSDKNLGITVTGDISDIEGVLKNLIELITSLPDRVIEITTNIDDSNINTLKSDLAAISDETVNVDVVADESGITNVENELAAIPDEEVNVDVTNTGVDEATQGLNDTSTAATGVSAAAGAAGLGIFGMSALAVTGAGNVQDQWSRIGVIFNETSTQAQTDWSGAMNTMVTDTGRGAGDVRNHIINMGLAGVTSKDVITESFDGIAAAAYRTNIPIDQVDKSFKNVVTTGKVTRGTLQGLGLTTDDLGMSTSQLTTKLSTMTTTQRAQYIADLLAKKGMVEANNSYKQSWEHVLDVMTRSGEYLMRILGGLILPLVAGALNIVSGALGGMAGWLDKLDGPFGTVVKLALGAVVAFGALTGVLVAGAAAWKVLDITAAYNSVTTAYNTVATTAGSLAKGFYTAAINGTILAQSRAAIETAGFTIAQLAHNFATEGGTLSTIKNGAVLLLHAGYNAVAALATGVLSAAQVEYSGVTSGSILSTVAAGTSRVALAVASGIATIATGALAIAVGLLNIIMDANPIMLVVLALAALVTGLIWAYNNIAPVKTAIDGLWNLITRFWTWMINIDGNAIWTWLWKGIVNAINLVTLPMRVLQTFILGVWNWISNLGPNIWGWLWATIGNAIAKVRKPIDDFLNFLKNLPSNMFKWGTGMINGLVNGIVSAIPGLKAVLNTIGMHFPQSQPQTGPLAAVTPEASHNFGKNLLDAVSNGYDKARPQLENILNNVAALFPQSQPQTGPLANVTPDASYGWGTGIIGGLASGVEDTTPEVGHATQGISDQLPAGPAPSTPKYGPLANNTPEAGESFGAWLSKSMQKGFENMNAADSFKGWAKSWSSGMTPWEDHSGGNINAQDWLTKGLSNVSSSTPAPTNPYPYADYLPGGAYSPGNANSKAAATQQGKELGQGYADGMDAATKKAITPAFMGVSDMTPQSPPKKGPLANITADKFRDWGSSLINAFGEGLNINKVLNPSNFSLPTQSMNAIGASGSSSGRSINLTVQSGAVVIQGNADKNVIQNAGTMLGESVKDILHGFDGKPNVVARK